MSKVMVALWHSGQGTDEDAVIILMVQWPKK
jgi:hypothetical protein